MLTPYDWQEGIGNRAGYIEAKLAQGVPVAAFSLPDGILAYTQRRQSRKVYEVYDRLLFAGVGQQSDVEAMRVAAVDFASQEGFQRSERDVTIQRVATALSAPLKRAFGDFGVAPLVVRALFAEVNETPEQDLFYVLDYDGDYEVQRGRSIVAGTAFASDRLSERLDNLDLSAPREKLLGELGTVWHEALDRNGAEAADDLQPEAVLLLRASGRENRFEWLTG